MVVSFRNQRYLVLACVDRPYSTLPGSRVTVREPLNGCIELLHKARSPSYRLTESGRRRSPPADEENLNARVHELLEPQFAA